MAGEEPNSGRRPNPGRPPEGGNSQKPAAPGSARVSTSDLALAAQPRREPSPERAVSFQTSQLAGPPSEYPFEPGAGVVEEHRAEQEEKQEGQSPDKKQGDGENRGNRHDDRRNDRPGGDDRDRQKKKKSQRQAAPRPAWQSLLFTGIVALVCGTAGAWAYTTFFGDSKGKQDQKSGDDDKSGGKKGGKKSSDEKSEGNSKSDRGSGEGGASASEIPGFNSATDAQTLKKELEHLAHRIDLLGARIDQTKQPAQETPPILHTLRMQMTDLQRGLDQVANLPSKLRQLEQRFSGLKEDFKTLKDQVSGEDLPTGAAPADGGFAAPPGLRNQLRRAGDAPAPTEGGVAAPLGLSDELRRGHAPAPAVGGFAGPGGYSDADPADNATLKLAIGLFHEGHFSQSYEVLRRLQRERPNDARVWYFSALANGLASGKWDDKTKRLVEQGIERERAGTPGRAEIDEALAGLTPATGREWLAGQRRQAKLR